MVKNLLLDQNQAKRF